MCVKCELIPHWYLAHVYTKLGLGQASQTTALCINLQHHPS